MQDPFFKARYIDVPAIVSDWTRPYRRIDQSEVLDFGCGEGITALGLALGFAAKRVVGIDIMPDPERCLEVAQAHVQLERIPPQVQLHRVTPGQLHSDSDQFDLAYSWSVFEHVDQTLVDHSLSLIWKSLRPGGLFLVQIAPLFYSAEGSHLNHVLNVPWAHLTIQQNRLEDMLRRAVPEDEARALWSTYITLNRITHQDLLRRMKAVGFEILRTHTTKDEIAPPPELLHSYLRDALVTNQVVALGRKLA